MLTVAPLTTPVDALRGIPERSNRRDAVPQDLDSLLGYLQSVARSVVLVVAQPEIAAAIVAGSVGVLVAYGIHRHFRAKARVLPYIPSLAEAVDGEHDETTRFLAAVHEMSMSITDAWNAVQARVKTRASVEGVVRADALLPACRAVRDGVVSMRARYADYDLLADLASRSRQSLSEAWSYRNRHNYRTEVYTVTSTGSDGKTRTQTRTRQVYEDTDHWFDFNRDIAAAAQGEVSALLAERRRRELPLPDVKRLRVRLDRVDPAQRMFLKRMVRDTILEDPEAEVDDATIADAANQWIRGARIDDWLGKVHTGTTQLRQDERGAFSRMMSSRGHYHYKTTSRSHGGPDGYRAARELSLVLSTVIDGWGQLQLMLRRCEEAAGELAAWARDRTEEEDDVDYVKKAIVAYEAAFPDSTLDIDQLPRHGWTVGLALLAAVVAGALTFFGMGGQI